MDKPFFSIIIPTYNRANFIAQTIASALNQEYKNFEVIIVDDGSTDNTEEIVKAIKSDKLTYHKIINSERGFARNYGAKKAKGNYVNFLDSDDLLYPNHLSEAALIISRNNNPHFFHLAFDVKDIFQNITKKVNDFSGNINLQLIKKGNILSCNGVFISKEAIMQNPFNEDRLLSASEDYELWLRLSYKYPIIYSNTITSSIINHENRSVLIMNKEKLIIRIDTLIKYILNNAEFKQNFAGYKKTIIANSYSYLSLHLCLSTHKYSSIHYLLKSIRVHPGQILTKRFFVILKKIVFKV